jgi:drug/metabolite transporter, DME family
MSRPISLVMLAAALWGTTGTAAFWLGTEVSPLAIGAATMGFGGVILGVTGGGLTLRVLRDRGARVWLILGALGVVVYPLTFYWGMSLAGIALGNVIALGLGPITVALLEWGVDRSSPTRLWWLSSGIALAGILVMSTAEVELGGGRPSDVPLGVLVATIAGVAYGLFTFAFGKIIDRGHHPRGVIGAVFGSGAPLLLGVVVVLGAGLASTPQQIAVVSYLVLGPMVIAYLAFSKALVSLRSSTVATVALLEPVIAAVLAVLVIGEKLGPFAVVGALAVLISIALLSRESGERPISKNAYS